MNIAHYANYKLKTYNKSYETNFTLLRMQQIRHLRSNENSQHKMNKNKEKDVHIVSEQDTQN